jgi:hypothetical protein
MPDDQAYSIKIDVERTFRLRVIVKSRLRCQRRKRGRRSWGSESTVSGNCN